MYNLRTISAIGGELFPWERVNLPGVGCPMNPNHLSVGVVGAICVPGTQEDDPQHRLLNLYYTTDYDPLDGHSGTIHREVWNWLNIPDGRLVREQADFGSPQMDFFDGAYREEMVSEMGSAVNDLREQYDMNLIDLNHSVADLWASGVAMLGGTVFRLPNGHHYRSRLPLTDEENVVHPDDVEDDRFLPFNDPTPVLSEEGLVTISRLQYVAHRDFLDQTYQFHILYYPVNDTDLKQIYFHPPDDSDKRDVIDTAERFQVISGNTEMIGRITRRADMIITCTGRRETFLQFDFVPEWFSGSIHDFGLSCELSFGDY